uniref:Uncharacterized protein n=1 Tax=viral metagenome TaxID=1070528 RepID=A0A6C0AD60_9ZZZZ
MSTCILLEIKKIPEWLHSSEFYKNLDFNNEIIEIPEHCLINSLEINNINDLFQYIHTINFWNVQLNYEILFDFVFKHKLLLGDFLEQCCEDYSIELFNLLNDYVKFNFNIVEIIYNKIDCEELFGWLIKKKLIELDYNLFMLLIFTNNTRFIEKFNLSRIFYDDIIFDETGKCSNKVLQQKFEISSYDTEAILNKSVENGDIDFLIQLKKLFEYKIISRIYFYVYDIIIKEDIKDSKNTIICKKFLIENSLTFSLIPIDSSISKNYGILQIDYIKFKTYIGDFEYSIYVKR